MKRYIRSNKSPQLFEGYCEFALSDDIDDSEILNVLHSVNGEKAKVRFKQDNGFYYASEIIYIFPDRIAYDKFQNRLNRYDLLDQVDIGRYYTLPAGTNIIELG